MELGLQGCRPRAQGRRWGWRRSMGGREKGSRVPRGPQTGADPEPGAESSASEEAGGAVLSRADCFLLAQRVARFPGTAWLSL